MNISVFKPFINRKEMDSVLSCLVNEKLENGAAAKLTTTEISKITGSDDGFLLKEYGRAIQLIFKALKILNEGKETQCYTVLMSPLVPVYYKLAAEEEDLEIVYVDADRETACISIDNLAQTIEELEKSNKKMLCAVIDSPLGFVPEVEKVSDIGIPIIEDISASFGASAGDVKIGCFGNFVILNLDSDKIITTGGGAFVGAKTKKEKDAIKSVMEIYGKDILLPDMNAAAALSQLSNLEKILDARKTLAEIYNQAIMKTANKTLIQKGNYQNVYYSFPVIAEGGIKEIKKYASKKGVDTADAFEDSIINKYSIDGYPEAKKLNMRCVLFPLYPNIGKSNAEKVVKVLSSLP